MFEVCKVLVSLTYLFLHISYIKANVEVNKEHEPIFKSGNENEDNQMKLYRKVALIDITFVNGKKRICTGAIIHKRVVITAGHCFFGPKSNPQEFSEPELTTSFVVIGTKKKIDSGYEQYLPIERILTHSNIKAWSCDLALVHTFASMTEDKMGAVIPLAYEREYSSIDPNVTILSWGRVIEVEELPLEKEIELDETEKKTPQSDEKLPVHHELIEHSIIYYPYEDILPKTTNAIIVRGQYKTKPENFEMPAQENIVRAGVELVSAPKISQWRASKEQRINASVKPPRKNLEHHSQNGRRQTGYKQGRKLTIETFELINALACKKLVEKIMARYDLDINFNEIVCYENDMQYVTDEDSGAPVIRFDQVIATTVGGIHIDGDHVALGMKLSYFCLWIAENLPIGEKTLRCGEESILK